MDYDKENIPLSESPTTTQPLSASTALPAPTLIPNGNDSLQEPPDRSPLKSRNWNTNAQRQQNNLPDHPIAARVKGLTAADFYNSKKAAWQSRPAAIKQTAGKAVAPAAAAASGSRLKWSGE